MKIKNLILVLHSIIINNLVCTSYGWINPLSIKVNKKITEPLTVLLKSYNEIRNISLVYPDYIRNINDELCWSNALTTDYFLNMTDVEASHSIKKTHISKLNEYLKTRGQRNNGRNITDILDIGCSFGTSTAYLKGAFSKSRVVGVDISGHMLAIAKERTAKDILYIHANAEILPIENNSFDMVHMGYICSTIPRDAVDNIIMECSRILRPGGILSIIDISPTIKNINPIFNTVSTEESKYIEEYIYWCSRAPDTLIDAGFVSVQEMSDIPDLNIKICWKSKALPIKFKEKTGDYDNFITRRNKNKKPSLTIFTVSSIITILFQLAIAFTYANLISTIYDKFIK